MLVNCKDLHKCAGTSWLAYVCMLLKLAVPLCANALDGIRRERGLRDRRYQFSDRYSTALAQVCLQRHNRTQARSHAASLKRTSAQAALGGQRTSKAQASRATV